MRWYVEVSRIGESGVAEEYCVAAKQWQAALQEARKLRGDGGALAQFSIELLDHGYRAVDPTLKLRYLVTQAPETATLTGSSTNHAAPLSASLAPSVSLASASASFAPRPSSLTPPRPASSAPRVSQTPGPQQLLVPDDPVPPPPVSLGAPVEAAKPEAAAASASGTGSLPSFELVRERSEEPRADSPITYRELAFAVEPGASREQVEALLNDRYLATLSAIADRPAGKFVQLAVFDHVFKRRPERPPLGTFAWKDWRGAPVMAFPGFGEEPLGPLSQVPPASMPSSLPPSNGAHGNVSVSPSGATLSLLPLPALLTPASSAPASATPSSTMPTSLKVSSVVPSSAPPSSGSLSPFLMVKLENPVSVPAPASAEPALVIVRAEPQAEESVEEAAAPFLLQTTPGAGQAAPIVLPVEPAAVVAESTAALAEPSTTEAPSLPVAEAAVPILEPAAASSSAANVASSEPVVADASVAPAPVAPQAPVVTPEFELDFESTPFNAAPLAEPKSSSGHERVSRPRQGIVGRRRAGEDLISELFEYMHELHFQRDIATGADFVLSVLDEVLPCEGVLIHVFDINTGHFVIVRAKGPNASAVLLQRMSDQDPFALSVMRSPRSISVPNAANDTRFSGPRWQAVGVAPRSALCGAVHQGGRYLGLIELVNPQGDTPFHFSELNALDYICEQFADFLSKKPLVLAADVVLAHI